MGLSYPELASLGGLGLWVAGAALVLAFIALLRDRRRIAVSLMLMGLLLVALSLTAVTDLFCVTGYIAEDGGCAWE